MIVDGSAVAHDMDQLLRANQYEQLLQLAMNFVVNVNNNIISRLKTDSTGAHTALFIPALDSALHAAGIALAATSERPQPTRTESKLILHVATELYSVGGHTRVLADVIRALPGNRHCVVLTDLFGRIASGELQLGELGKLFSGTDTSLFTLEPGSLEGKVRQLARMLATDQPHACFLFHHQMDVVATAAVSDATCGRSIMVHHSDHLPSLGPTRADYVHADLTPECHRECAKSAGNSPSFLGLTAEDRGLRWQTREQASISNVACAGPARKFWPDPAGLRYVDIVREVMRSTNGRYFHIGGMPAEALGQMQCELAAGGIDSQRFVDVGRVLSVWSCFLDLQIDLYIDSYPVGGGRTVIEALGAGLPIILPAAPERPSLFYADMTMGSAVSWRALQDIAPAVDAIRRDAGEFSARSRQTYERYYGGTRFKEAVRELIQG